MHRGKRLIRILPAGLLGGFPFPRRHWIRLRPQPLSFGPGQLFDVHKTLAFGRPRSGPGQPFFDQLMPYVAPVLKQNFGSGPALAVPLKGPYHNLAVAHIGGRGEFCLFPVGLLEFRAIDIFKMDRFAAAVVTNGQSIALMNSDDSRDKVSP